VRGFPQKLLRRILVSLETNSVTSQDALVAAERYRLGSPLKVARLKQSSAHHITRSPLPARDDIAGGCRIDHVVTVSACVSRFIE
jgi:hypothetical protein